MSQAHAAQRPNGAKEPANPTQGGRKAIIAAASANLAIAVTKAIACAFNGASSKLAEAIRSVADTANRGVLMLGGKEHLKE
ncbi:cation transporter, partial [Clostridioides difficile]|nr:cation transporter [Clostridioides difficile]